jgi:hypothetical protein
MQRDKQRRRESGAKARRDTRIKPERKVTPAVQVAPAPPMIAA